MARHHSSSASSGSSCGSAGTYSSTHTDDTDITVYSHHSKSSKEQPEQQLASPRASVETYASTVALEDEVRSESARFLPPPRYQCYEPDALPATSAEFAAIFPSTRRLMIQHDDSTEDGNMNIHVDTEVTTTRGRRKKLTLFHLRMKDLQERQFSLRRYCRDSGREVASCKKHYIKSTSSTPRSQCFASYASLTDALNDLSVKQHRQRADSGYSSADTDDDEGDDEEDERQMEERLNLMTSPADQVTSRPTDSMRVEFSNYAQLIIDRRKEGNLRYYDFEYWGEYYTWKRDRHVDDGEVIYGYDLIRKSDGQKLAVIMPDALSPQEVKWEAKQGGWVPASSMRLLKGDVSDHLGDAIMATGLLALTDDSLRRRFREM